MLGLLVGDVVVTRDEIAGLMNNLLYVDSPPTGTDETDRLGHRKRRNPRPALCERIGEKVRASRCLGIGWRRERQRSSAGLVEASLCRER